ncbi:hypothetical protein L1887_10370 [Cichorium endivia]|nr:hypothetical protein L1887_10370 [Cichorium endivia]
MLFRFESVLLLCVFIREQQSLHPFSALILYDQENEARQKQASDVTDVKRKYSSTNLNKVVVHPVRCGSFYW